MGSTESHGSSLFSVEWETSIAAVSGPGGANKGSRWEGSTAGRDAPTGELVEGIPRPGGAHDEVSHRQSHAPRRGAHTYGPPLRWVHLVPPSFPPATFMRASGAKPSPLSFHRKQRRPSLTLPGWFFNPNSEVDLTEANEGNEEPDGCEVIEWNFSGRAARPANPSPFVSFVSFCETCSGFRV